MAKNNTTINIRERLENPKTSLSEDELADLKKKVVESLELNRQKLLFLQPFTGGMLMRMEFCPIRDFRLNSAATDGNRVFFDIDFYKNLNENERIFVLAHEMWHVVYMHFLRKQSREAGLWNIATDCEINYMLKHEGFTAPENLCFPDDSVAGKSAEEIYEYLLKKQKKQKKDNNGSSESGKDKNDNSSEKKSSSNKGKSGSSGKLSGQFDKHIEPGKEDDENEGNGEKNVLPSDQWGEKGIDPDYTPRIAEDAAERIREMVISEVQRYERTHGTLPSGVENIINKLRNPTVPWRILMANFVTSCIGDKRQWLPPNRHHVWSGSYFQSRKGEKVKVVVAIDTSGSTQGDLPKFLTEVISLLKTFGNYEMRLIQCDAEIQSDEIYDDMNEFPLEKIDEIKFKGFGGTSFTPVFEKIEEEGNDANCLIYFTDSYGDAPKDPPPYPVMWLLTRDHDVNFCSWGERVVLED